MSDRTRARINAAFDDELSSAPVPGSLRPLSIRAAVAASPRRSPAPQLLALVAAVLVIALVATFVIGSHMLRSSPLPAKPIGSTTPPAPRAFAASTYDEAHGVMVVFGGTSQKSSPDPATWTWDGKYWVQLKPATSPAPRQSAAMAYDRARHEVVMFGGNEFQKVSGKGGCCSYAPVDDTWTWNGTTWQQRSPQHQPPLGFDFAPSMAYDPISRTVLLYGFTRSTSEAMTDVRPETWSWNGSDWTRLNPVSSPSTTGVMVTHDNTILGSDVLLLAQSRDMVNGRYIMQTWGWDGSKWVALDLTSNLPPLAWPSVAYDPRGGEMVALAGGDTWIFSNGWTRAHPTVQPSGAGYMVYMPPLHEVVSWGDATTGGDSEMYAWNGGDWKLIAPGVRPVGAPNTTPISPDQAVALVRSKVTTRPLLLPGLTPSWAYDAMVGDARSDGFTIRYQSDMRDKEVEIAMEAANPPPGTSASTDTHVTFRGTAAEYFVYDSSSPLSARWLMWSEGGSPKTGGVAYFMGSSGLTDEEFWQVANSLR